MFFATYDAKELAALASVLKIAGRSKMKKQELFDACYEVVFAAHVEALKDNDALKSAQISQEWQSDWDAASAIPCPDGIEGCEVMHLPRHSDAEDEPWWLAPYTLADYLSPGQKRL